VLKKLVVKTTSFLSSPSVVHMLSRLLENVKHLLTNISVFAIISISNLHISHYHLPYCSFLRFFWKKCLCPAYPKKLLTEN